MDRERFETGLEIRKSVLGREFVEKAFRECGRLQRRAAGVGDGVLMGRGVGAPGAGQKTRSLLNLAMISLLNRPHELKMHVAGALRNGVTRDKIKEVFLAVMIYASVPDCVDSFRIAREVFNEIDGKN